MQSRIMTDSKDYPSNKTTIPVQSSLSQKQAKFLEHFKTINNIDPITSIYNRQTTPNKRNQQLYMSKLESYSQSKISQIERILKSTQDENVLKTIKNQLKIQLAKPIIHAKPQIKKNLQRINAFFLLQNTKNSSIEQKKQEEQILQTQILQIGVYSEIIKLLPFKPKQQPKPQAPHFYSIYNTPTERPLYDVNSSVESYPLNNFNTQTQRNSFTTPNRFTNISIPNQSSHSQSGKFIQPEIKIRKADMLLVEILRQKKRKGLVADYYKIMELKLFELLDFILQDEPQYEGLSSIQKMKEVLKKLESFKGKKIEGENKINLLKIFFEEFRNLKNEIAESEKKKQNDESEKKKPLQKVENKPRPPMQKEQSQKEMKEGDKKGGRGQNWPKRTPIKQTMSVGGERKQRQLNQGVNRSTKGMQDQWLGQLQ